MSLQDKVAWITGGGSGIGLAGAIELAKAGCRVVISGRDATKLAAAVRQAEAAGAPAGRIDFVALDVADSAAVERVAQVFHDCKVTTDGYRIWVDDQLYGWVK